MPAEFLTAIPHGTLLFLSESLYLRLDSSMHQLWQLPHVCTKKIYNPGQICVCLCDTWVTAGSILHSALMGLPVVGAVCGVYQWHHLCLLLAGRDPPLQPYCPPWHGRHCPGLLCHRTLSMWFYAAIVLSAAAAFDKLHQQLKKRHVSCVLCMLCHV